MTSAKAAGVKPARQTRSIATHEAILEASLAAIREAGPDAFTLGDVVERAGLTTGAVYSRFRDKEALLFALYQHLVERWTASLAKAHAGLGASRRPLRREFASLFLAQIKVRRRDWRLRNAFLARIVTRSEYRRESAGMITASADFLVQALQKRREFEETALSVLKRRAGFVTVFAGASIERAITLREHAAEHLPRDDGELAAMLAGAAVAALRGEL